jgi:nucleoside-diphosphate-sugar epimerase
LVRVAFLALESPLTNKTYVVSDGKVYSDTEYTAIAKQTLGKKRALKIRVPLAVLKIVSVVSEEIAKLNRQPATLNRDKYEIMKQRDWTCDTLPLERDLHFQAGYDLQRGMRESVDWYRANGWL